MGERQVLIMQVNRERMIPGVVLLLFGSFLLLNQMERIPGSAFLIFLGVAFLAVYFITGKVGFLIPGAILSGFGIGVTVNAADLLQVPSYVMVFSGLALGFYLMVLLGFKKTGTWPLIPGTVVLLLALLIYFLESGLFLEYIVPYLDFVLPALLIAAGVWIVVRALIKPKEKKTGIK